MFVTNVIAINHLHICLNVYCFISILNVRTDTLISRLFVLLLSISISITFGIFARVWVDICTCVRKLLCHDIQPYEHLHSILFKTFRKAFKFEEKKIIGLVRARDIKTKPNSMFIHTYEHSLQDLLAQITCQNGMECDPIWNERENGITKKNIE